MSDDLFPRLTARATASSGLIQSHGNWHRRAYSLVAATLPKGWVGTGQDIRLLLTRAGLEPPHSPNAWGSMVGQCIKDGHLEHLNISGR